MKYQITFMNSAAMLLTPLLYAIYCIGFVIYFKSVFEGAAYIVLSIFFVIYFLPTIVVHSRYHIENCGKIYEISENGITIRKKNEMRFVKAESIQTIELWMTSNRRMKSELRKFPFEGYYFARLILVDDSEVILTCLLSKKLDTVLRSSFPHIRIINVDVFIPIFVGVRGDRNLS